jgi:hypothetical protein
VGQIRIELYKKYGEYSIQQRQTMALLVEALRYKVAGSIPGGVIGTFH